MKRTLGSFAKRVEHKHEPLHHTTPEFKNAMELKKNGELDDYIKNVQEKRADSITKLKQIISTLRDLDA